MIMQRFFLPFSRLRTGMPPRKRRAAGLAALALLPMAAQARDAAGACLEAPPPEAVLVRSVTDEAEFVLDDGRKILLSGIAFPDEALAVSIARPLIEQGGIRLAKAGDAADRWGRYRGHLATGGGTVSLAEPLIGAGAGLLDSRDVVSPAAKRAARGVGISAACAGRLAALEENARRTRAGIWGGANALPLDARNAALLQRFAGRFVIVEGKVLSVGERRTTTFLNFGPNWQRDFYVMIARKDWDRLAGGLTTAGIAGRRIAVRGEILLREDSEAQAGRAPAIRISAAGSLAWSQPD